MAGRLLTTQSVMQCPHGGTVTASSSNTKVFAGAGAAVLTVNDICTITGCPFQIPAAPSPIPSPCIKVQWVLPDFFVTVNGTPTLSEGSVGLCISALQVPQGNVIVTNTQEKGSSR
ncbi:MAG: hypothetical protein IPK19_00895 [Chloroflexi bacterium]|nr:hypothetical protein [Chloroflexota bacterium]